MSRRADLKPLPPQWLLKACLDYDPDTGTTRWRQRTIDTFPTEKATDETVRAWNRCHVGKLAFNSVQPVTGYRKGCLNYHRFYAHRIIWKLMHDEEPPCIDHINGNKADNRLCNLRAADYSKNAQNLTPKLGRHIGVRLCANGQWAAHMKHHGKSVLHKRFDTQEQAIKARRAAEARYGRWTRGEVEAA